MEQIEARILDRIYKLQVPVQERDRLMQAVELVDRKMREIRDAGKAQGPDRIAVNAALQLVYEFLGRATPATLVAGGLSADATVAANADSVDGGDVTLVTEKESTTPAAQPTALDVEAADIEATDAMGTGSRATGLKGADPRATDAKGVDSRLTDAKGAGPRSAESKGADLKRADLKGTDARGAIGKVTVGKGTEGGGLDSKAIDSKRADGRSADAKRTDPGSSGEASGAGKRADAADGRRIDAKGAARAGRAHEADKVASPSSPESEIERISSELEAEIRRQESLF